MGKRNGRILWGAILAAGLALASSAAEAAQVTLKDGSVISGQLVTMVMLGQDGNVYQLGEADLQSYSPGPMVTTGRPGVVRTFGHPGATAKPVPAPAPRPTFRPKQHPRRGRPKYQVKTNGKPRVAIQLTYQAAVKDTNQANKMAAKAGAVADVYAIRPGQDGMRYAWISLGQARRVEDQVDPDMGPKQEVQYMRELMNDPRFETRDQILAALEQARTYTHTMRYVFDQEVSVPAGAYTLHVELPKIRRHKKWHGVTLPSQNHRVFEYSWNRMTSFGR